VKKKCFRWYAGKKETPLASCSEKMKRNNCRLISFQASGYSNLEAIFLIFISRLIGYPNLLLQAIKNFKKFLSGGGRNRPQTGSLDAPQTKATCADSIGPGSAGFLNRSEATSAPFFILPKPAS
jgi:hypothetical protein